MLYRCSYHQARLWFIDKFESGNLYPSSPLYHNIPVIAAIEGDVDTGLLDISLQRVVASHPILRTRITDVDGVPFQEIGDSSSLAIDIDRSLYGMSDSEWLSLSSSTYEILFSESARAFKMDSENLVRVKLYVCSSDRYLLSIIVHHTIFDRESCRIFLNAVFETYSSGSVNSYPDSGIPYTVFSEWQLNLSPDLLNYHLLYWKSKLRGDLPVQQLPAQHRSAIHVYEADRAYFTLDSALTAAILSYTAAKSVPVYVFMLAAFKALLYRYSGQTDMIVGIVGTNRQTQGNTGDTIGPVSNLLPLRSTFTSDISFSALLDEVYQNYTEASVYHHMPFDKLVSELNLEKDMSRTALFDVLFHYEDEPVKIHNTTGLSVKVLENNLGWGKYDYNLFLQRNGETISGILTFNKLYYSEAVISSFLSHYQYLLGNILKDDDLPLLKMAVMGEDERSMLIEEYSKGEEKAYDSSITLVEMFERQVNLRGDFTALSYEGISLSYSELNSRSNRLGHYLRERYNIKADDLIGIMTDRSEWMITGILGILKSGAGYLPVDPGYPPDRRLYMLQDSGVKCVLVLSEEGYMLSPGLIEEVDIRSIVEKQVLLRDDNPSRLGSSSSLAYVIYTSGSTGHPKGVMVEHRNVVSLMQSGQRLLDYTDSDVWIMCHSYGFDFSVWEMYGALLYGGRLVLPSWETVRDVHALHMMVSSEGVTILNQTPGAFYNFITEELNRGSGDLSSHLRYVIFGGDSLEVSHLAPWISRYRTEKIGLINMYGITETTVHVSYHKLGDAEIMDAGSAGSYSNVGAGLDGVYIYILDKGQQLLPAGVWGELYVGGTGLSRGYLHNPEQTELRFITDPVRGIGKVYRTGDIGRWTVGGEIEYGGRSDNQVKLRGYRIELGEIERVLGAYAGVEKVVVQLRETEKGRYLVAYYTSSADVEPSALRSYAGLHLPGYMIPLYLIAIEELPLTSNGKIDRRNLPDPQSWVSLGSGGYVAASTDLERELVTIWQQVLGIERISVTENFFDLGGDSIKAIQISTRLYKLGYKLEIKDLFLYPTINSLSLMLEKPVIEIFSDQSVVKGEVPLTPIQYEFFKSSHLNWQHYNQSVLLKSEERYDIKGIRLVMNKLQEHHDALRMTYHPNSGRITQINNDLNYPVYVDEYDLSQSPTAVRDMETLANDLQASMDLDKGPMMRTRIFRLADGDRMLIAIHHLVIDGISWRILFEDLASLYQSYKTGSELILPLKTQSFLVWSEGLRAYADGDQFLKEKKYWKVVEATIVECIREGHAIENNFLSHNDVISMKLSEAETTKLLTKVNLAYGTNINSILLTGLGMAVAKSFGNKKVLIDMEGHGRENILPNIDIKRTIGWFTSLYPVILDMNYTDNLSRQIKEVKETLLGIPNKGIGYGILKHLTENANKTDMKFTLTPEIIFNYLGEFDTGLNEANLQVSSESIGVGQSLDTKKTYKLNITGMVSNKQLVLETSYNRHQFEESTIKAFVDKYLKSLVEIISHCVSKETTELTPSDLTYKHLSIQDLEKMNRLFN